MSNVIDFDSIDANSEDLFDVVYEHLALPDSTYLGTRITKKMILENNDLSSSDKKLVNEVVQSVEWVNTLKRETLNIPTYVTEMVEYTEVAVLKVTLKADDSNLGKLKNTAKLFHTLIPYPVILLIELDGQLAISLADKRINQSDSSKLVIEHYYNSQWFSVVGLKRNEKDFLNDFTLKNVSSVNYYELYQDFISMLLAVDASYLTGEYSREIRSETLVLVDRSNEEKTTILNKLANLEAELAGIRAKLKIETQMNQKMRLNVEAQQIKKMIGELTSCL
ncbi:DUF4391 domain-containing protein [Vibrio diabolicus]|uniref:DUF4391 domain-containing protein n=1 Tax=Vibrio harveyi group TaxID=717610 RepID=UPI0007981924|nr:MULTISPECIES: DUF4391 domain-containing protein [Vibrio harveyi group]EIV8504246.1 DUF4391 domain-containing protein [Vibrio parahaemolyticus]KXZ34528.1 methyl-accepting chemotaxis protein [Vibrio alginolyticus]MCS0392591.1 DUF4391 domain-containing protein [Vibrio diabolicus]HAS8440963.1 DUF4391 domain-containing protein [Vibrio vulnificus]